MISERDPVSTVTIKATVALSLAAARRHKLLEERQSKINAIADAVLSTAGKKRLLGITWGSSTKIPRDRLEAINLLETSYGYNDELLNDLIVAKTMHGADIKQLRYIEVAAELAIEHGDGMITLSLEHASVLRPTVTGAEHELT